MERFEKFLYACLMINKTSASFMKPNLEHLSIRSHKKFSSLIQKIENFNVVVKKISRGFEIRAATRLNISVFFDL
ncbi:hypothetical protein BpHYR1_030645 [Brachionus plicatilis]|uniref:Uncharacterized protein n=1 Tax=Brachionus plicatilis TaxID=10195 RepID=A0A3M7Q8W8_BRAPC|nr:hypothetical protein BpHYR1_030645 [Brachionus plicatilis]